MYNRSTFSLAQGVLRKKVNEDFTLGLFEKHLIGISLLNASQPKNLTKSSTITCKVLPCNGSFDILNIIKKQTVE